MPNSIESSGKQQHNLTFQKPIKQITVFIYTLVSEN